jgi:hypothetical protein
MGENRLSLLQDLYEILDTLQLKTGLHQLNACHGRMSWPQRGIYFFFDKQENRSDSGDGPRLIRVGTHALTQKTRTTLWNRLSQHKGTQKSGGGNHRGSIFRLLVGQALIRRNNLSCVTWGNGNSAPKAIREAEHYIEQMVSDYIGELPFLYLSVNDAPGPESSRGYIERNVIALLSNFNKLPLDRLSEHWLGNWSDRGRVKGSSLWNQNHVDETFDPAFISQFRSIIDHL